jgi:hypothetical protein
LTEADLLVGDEDVGILEHRLLAIGIGDEVRRDVALVELHALGELELQTEGLALLHGDDAVLADLVEGLGDDLPMTWSLLAEIDATWAISSQLVSMSRAISPIALDGGIDGGLDAPLELHRIGASRHLLRRPSLTIAWARTVAVVVPSPATLSVLLATS